MSGEKNAARFARSLQRIEAVKPVDAVIGSSVYRLTKQYLRDYENCEVCNKEASVTYRLFCNCVFRNPRTGRIGITWRHGWDLLGHKECLAGKTQ